MIVPSVIHDAELPLAERMAATLDGELYPHGDGHCPIDEIDRPALRAHAVLGSRPSRLIAELDTACWIWGARLCLPSVLEFCVDLRARARPTPSRSMIVREVVIPDDDVAWLGPFRVTTPLRTAVDLARSRTEFGPADHELVRALAMIGDFDVDECTRFMNRRRNLPAKRRAALRLSAALVL